MRITLKQHEIKKALLSFVAQSGIGGDAVEQAQVVFTKGRKGNGVTAEIVIGEDPVEETEVAEDADVAESADVVDAAPAATSATATEDAFA